MRQIYEDTISGTKSHRPGLDQALDTLRDGDTLVVWKLDRLGRSVKDLLDFAGGLNNRSIASSASPTRSTPPRPPGAFSST